VVLPTKPAAGRRLTKRAQRLARGGVRLARGTRSSATTLEGFVQQLAVAIFRHHYFWYVTGIIPEQKDPRVIDGKIIRTYGINVTKFVRYLP
jgi:hypothetical protein